jgi:hypothetical protein
VRPDDQAAVERAARQAVPQVSGDGLARHSVPYCITPFISLSSPFVGKDSLKPPRARLCRYPQPNIDKITP